MKKRTMKSRIAAGMIAVFTLFLFVTVIPEEVYAASNKAFKLKVSFNGKESTTDKIWDQNTYSVQTDLKSTSKVKKTTTVSYRVLVPKKLLKKNNDELLFCMDLILLRDLDKKELIYKDAGALYKTRWCKLSKSDGKVYLAIHNEVTGKDERKVAADNKKVKKLGSRAAIEVKGDYYVITMKDTLQNKVYDFSTGKRKNPDTKKTYHLGAEFCVHGDCSKLSGYIYLDEFTVTTAKKQTVTFNHKKEYKAVAARHFGGKKWDKNGKIVSLPF